MWADYDKERILKWSCPEPNTGCWLWLGCVSVPDGHQYGHISTGSLRLGTYFVMKAHRYSYLAFRGEIPDGMYVCHSCDQPSCVNPRHLFLGTAEDNAHDRDSKGRQRTPLGELHGKSKITNATARSIKCSLALGGSIVTVAAEHDVTKDIVSHIKRGNTWRHIIIEPEAVPHA